MRKLVSPSGSSSRRRRDAAFAFAGLLAISIMTGCRGVPGWVVRGSDAFSGDQGNAIYAVGAAAQETDSELQGAIARMNARAALAGIEREYVATLLRQFVENHEEWFDREYAATVKLYQQACEQVIDATRLDTTEVTTWLDKGGSHTEKGTLYALIILPLDDDFFDAVQQTYEGLIRSHTDKLLKAEPDAVFEELDAELKRVREDPLGAEIPAAPATTEGEGEPE